MSAVLRILEPGLLTTVQDLGRIGYQHLGVPTSGALDPVSLRAANILVGNTPIEGALEIAYVGPTFIVEADSVNLACAGADTSIEVLEDEDRGQWRALFFDAEFSRPPRPGRPCRPDVRIVGRLPGSRRRIRNRAGARQCFDLYPRPYRRLAGPRAGCRRCLAASPRQSPAKGTSFGLRGWISRGLPASASFSGRRTRASRNNRSRPFSRASTPSVRRPIGWPCSSMARSSNTSRATTSCRMELRWVRFRCRDTGDRSFSWSTGKRPEGTQKSRPLFRRICPPSAGRGSATKSRFRKPVSRKRSNCAERCCAQIDAIPNGMVPAHRTHDDLTACLLANNLISGIANAQLAPSIE